MMHKKIRHVIHGGLITVMLCFVFPGVSVADVIAPAIVHDAPAVINSPEITINITITDDVELAFVGFGEETPPLTNIQRDVVSPGMNSVTLTRTLTKLAEGEHRYLVVASDLAGNVTKTPIVFSYVPIIYTPEFLTLTDTITSSTVDLWGVSFVDVSAITVRGPQYTAIINTAQEIVACIGPSGEVTIDPAQLGSTTEFGLGIAGSLSGAGEYTITVEATGSNPMLAGQLSINNYPQFFLPGFINCP